MRNHLILLPGWGLGTSSLAPLVASLRAQDSGLKVEVAELPYLPDADPQTWVAELDRRLPKDTWLGGWSLGGMLAAELAARRDDHCRGLVTLASNLSFVARSDWPDGMAADTFEAFVDGCRGHTSVTLKRFKSLCSKGAQEQKSVLRQLDIGVPDTDPVLLVKGLEVLGRLDTRIALQAYGGPQLHLFAGADDLVPARAARALSDWLPDVEVGLVEDASHAFILEYPQDLAAAIKNFLHESGDD